MKTADRLLSAALALIIACAAQTTPVPTQSAPPPEVSKTAGAVNGRWVGSMTARLPGLEPDHFPWEMTCSSAALGFGASCPMKGTASIGPVEEACLLAYDPEGKAIHFMCVTSMSEVHDHKGQWPGDRRINFEPYRISISGHPATEDVTFEFPSPDRIQTTSVITAENGSRMTFEFSGSRR